MEITKVTHKPDDHVTVDFERLGKEGLDTIQVSSKDAPQPSFVEACTRVAEHVKKALGIPAKHEVQFRTATFKDAPKGADKVDGVIVTVLVKAPSFKSTYTVNTPLAPIVGWGVTDDADEHIYQLRDEAKAYVNGKRKQLAMDFEGTTSNGTAASGDGQNTAPPVLDTEDEGEIVAVG